MRPSPGASRYLLPFLMMLALLPGDARAEGAAVAELNGRVFADYSYDDVATESKVSGGTVVIVPGAEGGSWNLGGVLTTPVPRVSWLGGRLLVAGGRSSLEHPAIPPSRASKTNSGRVDAGGALFARDPEFGHFDVGYRYAWSQSTVRTEQQRSVHNVTADAGFYIPDQGIGPLDWEVSFAFGRASITPTGSSLQPDDVANEYTLLATIGWYVIDSLRLSGGALWERNDPQIAPQTQVLRGVGALDWLVPLRIGGRRHLTLRAYGGGGKAETDLAAPINSIRQTIWTVGGSLGVSYPGADSLVELTREYY